MIAAPGGFPTSTIPRVGRSWPLIGRAEEFRFVDAATRRRDGPRGVVLAGAAGVGKTRLARELVDAVQREGIPTRWVSATASARGLPFGAFGPLLDDVEGDPARVLRRAADALLAETGPAVVVAVDDAHLLDDLSAHLVHQLVVGRAAAVVVTVRTGEPAPDAVSALWKDGQLDRLELQPLSEPETQALLESALGGPVDTAGAARMWAMTRGNVLFLRHLVDGELGAGRLREDRGVWRWSGTPRLSPSLAELVDARMGGLSGPIGDVVDVLALCEPLDVSVLAALTDIDAVEGAEAAGLIGVDADGDRLHARLAHPLYGESRRARLGQLRARRLRGRVATALADTTQQRRGDEALRLAALWMDSDLDQDPLLLTEAAEHAARLTDLPLARRLGAAAVRAGGGFRAQAVVAYASAFVGEPGEADAELVTLTELASTDAELVKAAVTRAVFLAWPAARPADAEALLQQSAARVGDDEHRRPLIAMQAMLDGELGRPTRAERAALPILEDGRVDDAALMACCALVAALAVTGRADQAGPYVARGVDAAMRSADLAGFRLPLTALQLTGLRLAGCLDDLGRVAEDCWEPVKELPISAQIGCYLMGEAALARGRPRTATRWLQEARAGVERYGDSGGWRYATLISLTQALAVTGDVTGAERAQADLHRHRHPTLAFLDSEMILADAWVAAAQGAVSEAVALAHQAVELAARQGQPAHEVLALHTAARFGDRTVADRLATLAERVDGPRAPAAASHAAALAADDGDALVDASKALERMGDLLAAADAAAQAAHAHARRGLRGAAHAAESRARRLAVACEGARSPALEVAVRPLPLTDREREIVTLAANGLTNRQIADRLVVSVRTVEGHLYRAGAKLGVTTRAEFAALINGD